MSVPPLIIECFLPRINSKQDLNNPSNDPSPSIPRINSKQALHDSSMPRVGSKQGLSSIPRVNSKQGLSSIPRVNSKQALYESSMPRVGSKARLYNRSPIPRVDSKPRVQDGQSELPPVPEKYELINGILGIPSDVGIKLLSSFSSDEKKIRSFVALKKEIFEHIKQSKTPFTPPLVNDLSTQNDEDLTIKNNKVSIIKCSNHTGWTWAFVDYILEKSTSIFHLNLKYSRPSIFQMGFGVMEVNADLPFGDTKNAAMNCLYLGDGEVMQNGSSEGNHPWKENDLVTIEVNTQDSTLRFYINGRQQAVSYSNIPPRLRFCVAEECKYVDRYNIGDPNLICARYMHRIPEVRLADSVDEIEVVSFRRFVSEPKPKQPPADVYDPDHLGFVRRVLEWNYLEKKGR